MNMYQEKAYYLSGSTEFIVSSTD